MMWCLRNLHGLTTGIVGGVGAVVLFAAVWLMAVGATTIAAIGVLDAIVIGLGAVLSALVAVAGTLLAADMRADRDCARAWQSLHDPIAWTIEQPAEVDAIHGWHNAYATRPQDERLQAILRVHHQATPLVATGAAKFGGDTSADNCASIARASSNVLTAISVIGSTIEQDQSVHQTEKTEHVENRPGFVLIANTTSVEKRTVDALNGRVHRMHRSMRNMPKVHRVANAERWWSAHDVSAESLPWSVAFRRAADVIVLADRGGRNHPPRPPDHSIDATAPAQPACRGPPYHANAGRSPPPQRAFGGRHRPKIDAATELDALLVVDNLGDTVPVGAAELSVIETFLDDVLRDVLTTLDSGQDDSTT
jgi:hypothetical protein